MKIRKLIIGTCAVVSANVACGATIQGTDASAYLDRGKKLYNIENYTGAMDQLSQVVKMISTPAIDEEVAFYMAMCDYNNKNARSIESLNKFLAKYPASLHAPEVLFAIGNKYFYTGRYGEAVTNYNLISEGSLDDAQRADLIYRRGYSKLKLGDYDSALDDFKRVASVPKYRLAVTFYQGYVDYVNGDYDSAMTKFQKINSKTELGYNAQYYMAQIYFTRGDYDRVISMGKTLMQADKNTDFTPELNRIIGESYYQTGDDTNAKSYLENYLNICNELNPAQRSAYYVLGVIYSREKRYEDVVNCMNYVTDVNGEGDAMLQSAYLYAGNSYEAMGNTSSAMMAFEKAMRMPYDKNIQETAFFNYAVAQSKGATTPFSRAIDYFEEFINKFPNSRYQSQVEDYLVNAYVSGHDYQKAYTSISHIKNPSNKVLMAKQYVLYNLGVNAYSNNQTAKALSYLTQGRALGNFENGILANCDLWIGDCQYRKGNYSAAEKSYKSFVNAATSTNSNRYLGYYDLGYAQYQQKEYSAARASFEKAVASGSNLKASSLADAYNRIGDTYYYAKDFRDAETKYAKALALHPASGDYALYQQAMMLGLERQFSTKISKLDQLMGQYPNSSLGASAMFEKGSTMLDMNNNEGAAAVFEKLLTTYPKSSEARKGLLQLAITMRNEGKSASAITNYRKVISKYPSSEEAALAVEDLKVIYAEMGRIEELTNFLDKTPNAPKIAVSEVDKLTFDSAEKAFLSEKNDITKVKAYLKKYPHGSYATNAQFYVAQDDFAKGHFDSALTSINEVLEKGGDASYSEDALAMKGAILSKKGQTKQALQAYKDLSKKATTSDHRVSANLGIMRASNELGQYSEVITAANSLINGGGLSGDEENEAMYLRATAYSKTHKSSEAEKDWATLAKDTRNIYGAKASYYLAEHYYNAGNMKQAEKVLNTFAEEGTPHEYWLARGFILLSDIYAKQGKKFEAREYLESLKNNYPGKESDIHNMIDERLKTLKK